MLLNQAHQHVAQHSRFHSSASSVASKQAGRHVFQAAGDHVPKQHCGFSHQCVLILYH